MAASSATPRWIGVLLLGLLSWAFGGVGARVGLLWRNRREIVRRVTRRTGPHSP